MRRNEWRWGEEDDEVDDEEADEEANQYHSEEIYNHDLPIIANFSSKIDNFVFS